MPEDMTTPAGQADAGNENWEQRYLGLQRVLSKRDAEVTEARRALDEATSGREADLAELTEYRAQRAAVEEEARAQAEYQRLRDRFEPESPTPLRWNGARDTGKREPSAADLVKRLDGIVGKTSDRENWSLT